MKSYIKLALFFLSTVFFYATADAEKLSPDNFEFIDQNKDESIFKSKMGVVSKATFFTFTELINAAMYYYGCKAVKAVAANSFSPQNGVEQNDINSEIRSNICLNLASIIASREVAMVSRSSPWPNVSPWLESYQVLGALSSGYFMYTLKRAESATPTSMASDFNSDNVLAFITGSLTFLSSSSLGSTFSALGSAHELTIKGADFNSEEGVKLYTYNYKVFDFLLACAIAGTMARSVLDKNGYSTGKAIAVSTMITGAFGMFASIPIADVPGHLEWVQPINITSLDHLWSNPSEAIDEMISSFQIPIAYKTNSVHDLTPGAGMVLGMLISLVAANPFYQLGGVGTAASYAAMASSAGAVMGASHPISMIAAFSGGLFGVLVVPGIMHKLTPEKEISQNKLIVQTGGSIVALIAINCVSNFLMDWQSVEGTLTDTSKWIWRKLHAPLDYLYHILSLN